MRSFDEWANSLAESIAAKNPPKPKTPDMDESTINLSNASVIAQHLNKLYEKDPKIARTFLADIILSSRVYLYPACKEADGYWNTIHKSLVKGEIDV